MTYHLKHSEWEGRLEKHYINVMIHLPLTSVDTLVDELLHELIFNVFMLECAHCVCGHYMARMFACLKHFHELCLFYSKSPNSTQVKTTWK